MLKSCSSFQPCWTRLPPPDRRQRRTLRRQIEPGVGMTEVEIDGVTVRVGHGADAKTVRQQQPPTARCEISMMYRCTLASATRACVLEILFVAQIGWLYLRFQSSDTRPVLEGLGLKSKKPLSEAMQREDEPN
jgi:hypothetical protein